MDRVHNAADAPKAEEVQVELIEAMVPGTEAAENAAVAPPEARRRAAARKPKPAGSSKVPVAAVKSNAQRVGAVAGRSKAKGVKDEVSVKVSEKGTANAGNSSAKAEAEPEEGPPDGDSPRSPTDHPRGSSTPTDDPGENEDEREEAAAERDEAEVSEKATANAENSSPRAGSEPEEEAAHTRGSSTPTDDPEAASGENEDEREEAEVSEKATANAGNSSAKAEAEPEEGPPDGDSPRSPTDHPRGSSTPTDDPEAASGENQDEREEVPEKESHDQEDKLRHPRPHPIIVNAPVASQHKGARARSEEVEADDDKDDKEVEEDVSVDTGVEAEPPQAEEGSLEFPTEAGCFLRTPSGCPNHPTFGSRGWRHDTYAEKYTRATENLTECEVTRKARLVEYCGTEDAETLFVPSIWGGQLGNNEAPIEEGCYVRTPSGCPNHPTFDSSIWRHEEYGERATTAKVNRTACEVTRREHVAHWCGVEDVEMLFVAPPPPGCYVRTPAGCPNHPEYASTDWKHEEFGENFTQARENRTVCEFTRRTHIAHWCGTINVHMLFIPAGQDGGKGDELRKDVTTPTEPGCFMLTPAGCPNHPTFGKDGWDHDRVGELSGARRNRALCEGGRKEQISHWCGTEDVEAFFVPSPEPGCYVRTPSGCPKHPHFGSSNWTHEEYGETYKNARLDRMECEVARKAHVMHWCGTEDVQMSFVPPDWDSLIVVGPGGGEGGPQDVLEPPSQPGCYVRTPSGCPKHPSFNSSQWKHEDYGERNTRASNRRGACETARKAHVAHWCGAEDVEMLFIPTPEPGCYMRTPSGCPDHPEFGTGTWRRDEEEGETSKVSQTDRSVCEGARQGEIALWCGAEDAETLFIPGAAA